MMESVIEPQRERERERQRELWPRESVIAAGESDGGRCVCVCVSGGFAEPSPGTSVKTE